jgi:hypothetical protein
MNYYNKYLKYKKKYLNLKKMLGGRPCNADLGKNMIVMRDNIERILNRDYPRTYQWISHRLAEGHSCNIFWLKIGLSDTIRGDGHIKNHVDMFVDVGGANKIGLVGTKGDRKIVEISVSLDDPDMAANYIHNCLR